MFEYLLCSKDDHVCTDTIHAAFVAISFQSTKNLGNKTIARQKKLNFLPIKVIGGIAASMVRLWVVTKKNFCLNGGDRQGQPFKQDPKNLKRSECL